ncbi:ester cyclase [Streptomyces thermolilacinus]|uniref:ester cyclase n=1 Tax=Streptomyces thermolilacinus TaxID=285540 RepID=UPI0033EBD015
MPERQRRTRPHVHRNQQRRPVHRFYQALQQGDYDTLTGMFHPDFVFYPQIDSPRPGAAGFIDAEKKHVDAFSDIRLTVLDTVAEADKVGAYVAVEGDQGGDYYGIPHAERTYVFPCATWVTFKDGKITEKRAHYNLADIMDQLTAGSAA